MNSELKCVNCLALQSSALKLLMKELSADKRVVCFLDLAAHSNSFSYWLVDVAVVPTPS